MPPVCIIAHNEQECIARTISSATNQSTGPVFVFTNGCTDNTNQIVADIAKIHPRVNLMALPLKGKVYALRECISFLSCFHQSRRFDRVFFLDADVTLPTGSLTALSEHLDSDPALYLVSAASAGKPTGNWFLDGLDKARQIVHKGLNANTVRGRCYVITWDALRQVDYPDMILSDDMFLEVRLFGHYTADYSVTVSTSIKSTVAAEIHRDLFLQIARDQVNEYFQAGHIKTLDRSTSRKVWGLRYPTGKEAAAYLLKRGRLLSLSVLLIWGLIVRMNRGRAKDVYDRKRSEDLIGHWTTSR